MNLGMPNWVPFAMFAISLVSAAISYFKAMSDIPRAFDRSLFQLKEDIREEMRSLYATKEETRFQHETLLDIKAALREINQKLEIKGDKQ